MLNLNTGILAALPIVVPPREQQDDVVQTLDSAGRQVILLEKLVAKKRDIKQGVMQQLLTAQSRLPGFDQDWVTVTLSEVARIKTGRRNNQDKQEWGRYPFFVRSAVVERIDSYSYDCEAILVPGEGAIGSTFHYVDGKFEVHQRVYKISDFATDASGKFIYYVMRQYFGAHAMENSVKATVDSLRLPTFLSFAMRVPDTRTEQEAIVRVLDDVGAELVALERRLESAREVKLGMMQKLLTGRTRLTEEIAA